ncbi:unnamed protein product [Rotaria socialis]|uniref:Uncharacterized protein n=1 Tax=Rotaria socialis TaxID=392032 RepID=A0A820YK02_9BILA|nr:unnamed protein product [Rotaria socialis]CAF4546009.1 unnamed protein product [Rotaria socialis]
MSRRIPSFSDLNIRTQQPIKRFKTAETSADASSYRNIFEQFDDVSPPPKVKTTTEKIIPKTVPSKLSSQQFSSTSSSTARSIMAKQIVKQDDELWSMLFQPKSRYDLILHQKKIKDLEQILQISCGIVTTDKRPSKLILISGPTGSGKSTCLRILAASLNINIVEWETRTTSSLTNTAQDEYRDDRQWTESQKRSFRTFAFQSTRYLSSSTGNCSNGLIFEDENEQSTVKSHSTSSTKQIVLIEVSSHFFY